MGWGGGEGERESQAGSMLSTKPDEGLNLTTLRSWPEPKSRATQAPHSSFPLTQRTSYFILPRAVTLVNWMFQLSWILNWTVLMSFQMSTSSDCLPWLNFYWHKFCFMFSLHFEHIFVIEPNVIVYFLVNLLLPSTLWVHASHSLFISLFPESCDILQFYSENDFKKRLVNLKSLTA